MLDLKGFVLNPLHTLYQISEITSIPPSVTSDDTESTISSNTTDNNLHINSLLYTNENLNLENLFAEMVANQADIQALTNVLQNVLNVFASQG
ncbi:10573_t:CDS:2 [Funneliformis geosporum]|uniref:10573_t:CDS:1 n=1 Tax=Funneliformis geosporum TaxID=1117311 RepID=A0A9W4SZ12_9GLOM|nr:10573_t:CDS:2 [Funneliformis geosporum]